EISATVLVAIVVFTNISVTWEAGLIAAGSMIVISFVFWGVAPRTLGRQHADAVSLAAAGPLRLLTTVLGPLPRLLIMIG
ncbi:CNNM domain-containing protein, partial [Staphylococcus aureus]|nr:CNNM domain-containing protein [Staphylococcus aureus]